MKVWFEVLSDLLINVAGGWFIVVLIEPQVNKVSTTGDYLWLLLKLILGILSLVVAKYLKERSK